LAAWEATPKADPPRPDTTRSWLDRPVVSPPRRPRPQPPAELPADTHIRKVSSAGTIRHDKVFYKIDVDHAFKQVLVVTDGNQASDKIIITNLEGEILAEHTRPEPGITYVGNGRPPGTRPKNPGVSPKS
jgi:putative transposase